MKIDKKQAAGIGVIILVVAVLMVVAYISKHKEKAEEPPPSVTSTIQAEITDGKTGTVTDTIPLDIWEQDESEGYNGFTTRSQLGVKEGSVGLLSIDKINVECPVFDSENTMEDMKKGASHFTSTSYWDGNVALSAHIGKLDYCYFDRLKELKEGDSLSYKTAFGTRNYAVQTITVVSDEDWNMMERTNDNRLTLITCIAGNETKRLCVQAVEV